MTKTLEQLMSWAETVHEAKEDVVEQTLWTIKEMVGENVVLHHYNDYSLYQRDVMILTFGGYHVVHEQP